jgi:streptogramin lyase
LYDNSRNVIWFTDARTNSIGKLDANNSSSNNTSSSKVELINVPTPKAGPMGIVMSPDHKTIWFAEITGDKVASLDIASNKVTEYPTGEMHVGITHSNWFNCIYNIWTNQKIKKTATTTARTTIKVPCGLIHR